MIIAMEGQFQYRSTFRYAVASCFVFSESRVLRKKQWKQIGNRIAGNVEMNGITINQIHNTDHDDAQLKEVVCR